MQEIHGVNLCLTQKSTKSLWVKAEFSPKQWQKIPELNDVGINAFFRQFVPEYFHKNKIDKPNRTIWSPLIYDYKLHTNLPFNTNDHEKLPHCLQMLYNANGGNFHNNSALEITFNLRNYLLLGYQTPFGGGFGLKNSKNQPIALQHFIYQGYSDNDKTEYDLPTDKSIAINVGDNLVYRVLGAFDIHMWAIGFDTRWGSDYEFCDKKLTFATNFCHFQDFRHRINNWPGWNPKDIKTQTR